MEFIVKNPKEECIENIYDFFVKTNDLTIPPLSQIVNLKEYTEKIHSNATLFEYIEDNRIIALNAVYVNKYPQDSFATSLAVLPEYEGYGIGAKLILKAINYCKKYGSQGYRLQMRSSNIIMLDFYLKRGFSIIQEDDYSENVKGVILKLNFK